MIKIATILGTRPEIIRLSRVISKLNKFSKHVLIHTGQNYDNNLSDIFFNDLKIPNPHYYLGVNNNTLGTAIGEIISKTEEILNKEKPNAVLVLGDTNSGLSLLIAKRMNIPTYHMEAGNRSFDINVPEEINRKVIDHIADFNLVYTEHARRNLLYEGIDPRFIALTGSPMREVINFYKDNIEASDILKKHNLKKNNYLLVSIHREENTDDINQLENIINSIVSLKNHYKMPIIFPTHPRTITRITKSGFKINLKDILLINPLGFFDYAKLQKNSFCTISDSGTISEESALLGFNAVTLRRSIERYEAIDCGNIMLTDFNLSNLINAIEVSINTNLSLKSEIPKEYLVNDTSNRVVKLILGTCNLANNWLNRNRICRNNWEEEFINKQID